MRAPSLSLTFVLALTSTGCRQILGVDGYQIGGHGARGRGDAAADSAVAPAIDYDVGCLGSVTWPAPTADSITFSLNVLGANSTLTLPHGLVARACYDFLPDCGSSPNLPEVSLFPAQFLFTAPDPYAKDRFFDHIAVRDPSRTYFDYLLYFFPYPVGETAATANVWKRSELPGGLGSGVDPNFIPLDPRLGVVTFDVYDCNSTEAAHSFVPGVSVSLDDGSTSAGPPPPTFFYGYPPAADPRGHTDGNGLVYITNVAPGVRTVTAMFGNRHFGTVKVRVEADHITAFHLVPTPEQ